jgi:hypothetical protein
MKFLKLALILCIFVIASIDSRSTRRSTRSSTRRWKIGKAFSAVKNIAKKVAPIAKKVGGAAVKVAKFAYKNRATIGKVISAVHGAASGTKNTEPSAETAPAEGEAQPAFISRAEMKFFKRLGKIARRVGGVVKKVGSWAYRNKDKLIKVASAVKDTVQAVNQPAEAAPTEAAPAPEATYLIRRRGFRASVKRVGSAMGRGARRAGSAIKSGSKRAGSAIKAGAKWAAPKIKAGAKWAYQNRGKILKGVSGVAGAIGQVAGDTNAGRAFSGISKISGAFGDAVSFYRRRGIGSKLKSAASKVGGAVKKGAEWVNKNKGTIANVASKGLAVGSAIAGPTPLGVGLGVASKVAGYAANKWSKNKGAMYLIRRRGFGDRIKNAASKVGGAVKKGAEWVNKNKGTIAKVGSVALNVGSKIAGPTPLGVGLGVASKVAGYAANKWSKNKGALYLIRRRGFGDRIKNAASKVGGAIKKGAEWVNKNKGTIARVGSIALNVGSKIAGPTPLGVGLGVASKVAGFAAGRWGGMLFLYTPKKKGTKKHHTQDPTVHATYFMIVPKSGKKSRSHRNKKQTVEQPEY